MDGNYFYFFAWVSWIIVTFFWDKEDVRWKVSALLLLFIICSPITISIASFTIPINITLLGMIAFLGIAFSSLWKQIYTLFSVLIIAMLYTSFHLLELYDPIWIVLNRTWMLSGIVVYASILLHRNRMLRLDALYAGVLQGEILVTFIFRNLHFPYQLGSLAFFDIIAVSTILFALLFYVVNIAVVIERFKKKNMKERQG